MSEFTFSSSMTLALQTELNELKANLDMPGAGATAYEDILVDISQTEIVDYGKSPAEEQIPAANVDPAVWDYFNGAILINQNSGAAGQFVNFYTIDQYKIRDPSGTFTQGDFSFDSNEIAVLILQNILDTDTLPSSVGEIAEPDVAGIAQEQIFKSVYNGQDDATGWGGTLLLTYLGDSSFFSNLLLNTGTLTGNPTNNSLGKVNPGMYDFIAALDAQGQASASVTSNPLDLINGLLELLDPQYANIPNSQAVTNAAVTAANNAFEVYYNLVGSDPFLPGNDLIFSGPFRQQLFQTNTYIAGAAVDGELIPTSGIKGNAVIVGGSGNNTVMAPSSGVDLIDGGVGGNNTLDLSDVNGNLIVKSVFDPSGAQELIITNSPAQGEVGQGLNRTIYAYNFSKVILNSGNDTVTLNEGDVPGLKELDTGGGTDTVQSTVTDLSIDFGDGPNDTLLNAGAGTVVEAGTGNDTFNISNDVLITGITTNDRVSYAGNDVYGALQWQGAQTPWAVNSETGISFAYNKLGDLVVKDPLGNAMYIADYVGGPGAPYNDADIFVGVESLRAYRLLDPNKPNVNFVDSQFEYGNSNYKVQTGKPLFPGGDPLVLDLTSNGFDLIGQSSVSPLVDINDDNFDVHTGWVKPDDGFLVWDKNGNGDITPEDFFGSPESSGFTALLAQDSNGDGVINASDPIFSQLKVWQDLNGNGVVDPGELQSLTQLGITSINLTDVTQTDNIVAGNTVTETATFSYANGTTGTIGDISFVTDNFNSTYTGGAVVSAAAAAEPNLKGYGTLTDLQVAMTLDPALVGVVNGNLPNMDTVDLTSLSNAAMPIFTAWANAVPLSDTSLAPGGHSDISVLVADNGSQPEVVDYAYQVTNPDGSSYWKLASGHVVTDSSGNVIPYPTLDQLEASTASSGTWMVLTGAELDFAERYAGDPILINGNQSDPSQSLAVLGPELTGALNAINIETVRLAMQGPLAPYFAGLTYDAASDTFDVTTDYQLTPMFTAIFANAPSNAAGAEAWLAKWKPILDVIEGNLAPSEGLEATYGYLFASMVGAYEATSMPLDIQAVAAALGIPSDLIYDSGTTLAPPNADANIIYASGGDQTIIGSGGPDNDVFGSNFGNDVINNQNVNQEPDILWFATLNPSDITASRDGVNLLLKNNKTGAVITVLDEFIGYKPDLLGTNINPVTGVSQIVFANGTVWDMPDISYAAGLNTNGVDGTLLGTPANDVLDGDNGNTFMSGGDGGDIYLYDRGDGQDTIEAGRSDVLVNDPDIVSFGADITPSDVTFTRQGNSQNLIVEINDDPSDTLTIIGEFSDIYTGVFGTVNFNEINGFQFADGTEYSSNQIQLMVLAAEEAVPNNSIYGFDGNDVIDPGVGGNDYMSGGNGNDTYIFGLGYGNDTIYDGANNLFGLGDDTVLFNADINPSDVTFTRSGDSNNLQILINGDPNDSLTILGQFESTYTGVFGTINFNQLDSFQFANGTTYSNEQIEKLVLASEEAIPNNSIYGFDGNDLIDPGLNGNDYMSGGNGNDTYVFGFGYGHDTILQGASNLFGIGNDTVLFGAGVDPSDVSVERNGNSHDITLILSDGSSLTIEDQLGIVFPFVALSFNTIESFQFQDTDGTVWNDDTIKQLAIAGQAAVPGGAIYGFYSNDYIDPGVDGNHFMSGGDGNDTYVFGFDYGHDTILKSADDAFTSDNDTVLFNAGIDPSDVTFVRNDEYDLTIFLSDGSELDILNEFNPTTELASPFFDQIQTFQFQDANQTSLSFTQVEQKIISEQEEKPDSTIMSFYGGDTLDGASGNDTLIGINGANTFQFGVGYGNEVVSLNDGGNAFQPRATAVISFGAGITPASLQFSTYLLSGNETITFGDGTDSLTLQNFGEMMQPGYDGAYLVGFQFSDGTFWSASQIANILETDELNQELAEEKATLSGPFPNNYIDPGLKGQHDIISAGGANTYAFGLGYGHDTIQDYSSGGSEILFNSDVDPSTVEFRRGANTNDLEILLPDGSELDVSNEFLSQQDGLGFRQFDDIGSFDFQSDPSADMSLQQVESEVFSAEESVPDSTIFGFHGGTQFDGYAGNETLIGFNGANTFFFNSGYGKESVGLDDDGNVWDQRATGIISFGSSINKNSLQFSGTDSGNETISFAGSSDSLTILNFNELINPNPNLNQPSLTGFQFSDGTFWDAATVYSMIQASANTIYTWYGSSTDTDLSGINYRSNAFYAAPGGDEVTFGRSGQSGIASNTVYFNIGDGRLTINPNGAFGDIQFGPGITENDVIYQSDAAGDLTITLLNANGIPTGDSVTIDNALYDYQTGPSWSIQNNFGSAIPNILFADGTSIAVNGNLTNTWIGNASNTDLVGSDWGENLFELGAGGDSITFGNGSNLSSNWNTIDFGFGDGAATINPNGGFGDIQLGAGITQSDVIYQTDAAGDLKIVLLDANGDPTGDSLTIDGAVYIYQTGPSWSIQNNYGTHIPNILFADGSSVTINGNLTNTWIGTTTSNDLVGSDWGANLFELGAGGDSVIFGNGSDLASNWNTVDFGLGDGIATVNRNGATGVIQLDAGITQSDVAYESDAEGDLTIVLLDANGNPTGDSLTINNVLYTYQTHYNWSTQNNFGSVIPNVVFSDGTSVAITGNLTNTWFGTALDKDLVGSDWAPNLFELGPGGDSVTFGNGSNYATNWNVVDFGYGDGAATVSPNGGYGDIQLAAGINQNDVAYESDAAGDLTIVLLDTNGNPTGDSVTVDNALYIYQTYYNWSTQNNFGTFIPNILFADGSSVAITGNLTNTWFGTATNTDLVGSNWAPNLFELGAGGDTVVFGNGSNQSSNWNTVDFNTGDGEVTVITNGGYGDIQLGTGITQNDVAFESDAAGDLTIILLDANGNPTGDHLTVDNALSAYQTHYNWSTQNVYASYIPNILFADGSNIAINGNLTNTWFGTKTDNDLVGSDWGSNLFELGAGDDSVTFGNGSNFSSNWNTVEFGFGDGTVTVNPNGGYGDVQLDSGITQNDVAYESDPAGDLTVILLDANGNPTGDSLTIDNALSAYQTHYNWSTQNVYATYIPNILFADGSNIAVNGNLTNTWFGTATDTNLVGSEWGENLFELGAGGDSVTFGNGSNFSSNWNTVLYNIGDGPAVVNLNYGVGDIKFGAGITASDIYFEADASGDLTILFEGDPSDSLYLEGALYENNGINSSISDLYFQDGTSIAIEGALDYYQPNALVYTWIGTSNATTLSGTHWGTNIFDLGPGGDTVNFGTGGANGGPGGASAWNVVNFAYGDGNAYVNTNGFSGAFQLGAGIAADDLVLDLNSDNSLTINLLDSSGNLTGDKLTVDSINDLSSLTLSDGTQVNLNSNLTVLGSPGNDTLTARASGDTIDGGFGNDFEQGSSGSDTFLYKLGYGDDYISAYDVGNANSTIEMGAGITESDVSLQRGGGGPNWDLLINVAGAGTIQIGAELSQRPISQIDFSDGTSIDLTGSLMFSADQSGQIITSWVNGDTLTSASFSNITLNGGGNSTNYLFSGGDGRVDIQNSNSASDLTFAPGITDNDLWFSQSGSDLMINVIGSSDAVDIKNWFSGGASAQLAEIQDGKGLEIDTGINQLVSAMATFEDDNPGFNPVSAIQMPNDNSIQAAIAAAWHSQIA